MGKENMGNLIYRFRVATTDTVLSVVTADLDRYVYARGVKDVGTVSLGERFEESVIRCIVPHNAVQWRFVHQSRGYIGGKLSTYKR